MSLITVRSEGLYCEAGEFYIDPWQPVETALITHAHADHARSGSQQYVATAISETILRKRLGEKIALQGVQYGEKLKFGNAWVSFHSAGHVMGSAQIRVEHKEEVWVVSGDYKRCADPTCEPFERVSCDVFITEATFGLPIYKWDSGEETGRQIYDWWQGDRDRPSILFCYAFGKAQRVLSELTKLTDQTVYVHGAIAALNESYRAQNIPLLTTVSTSEVARNYPYKGDLILAPPSGYRSNWMKRFKSPQTAFASGWMAVRGARRRRGYERGFVLSDHADWPSLIRTIQETGTRQVYVTHGQNDVLSRYLREVCNIQAEPLETLFEGEGDI
ncbi:MAG: ligase-associated DNA damage response exonuclease [Leptolyngbya sp. SIO1D8]|nr:ligase-associated DNA damage response exonuclease [Leptolyngbya sp. SIO1D8]